MTLPWLSHYDPGVPRTLAPYPERGLPDYLADAARESGDQPWILFKGARMTYGELARLSDAFAAALASLGVKPGDRVALCLPNCPQFLIAQFGAWKAGAIVCPFNPTYTDREMEDALRESGAETIVVLNRFYERFKKLQPRTAVRRVVTTNIKEYLPPLLRVLFTLFREREEGDRIAPRDGDVRLTTLLERHHGAPAPAVAVRATDPATILMSGGTTGSPKGVVGTHQAMVMAALQLREWMRPSMAAGEDVILLPLPLFHTYANTGVQSLALVNRNPLALVPNPRELSDVLKTINRVKPAFVCAVPTLLSGIINHPMTRAGKVSFRSIKLCFSGAAALMAETQRRFEEMTGGVIVEGYSLTEAQMAVVANPVLGPKKIGSVGMALPDVVVRVVDSDDGRTPMPTGETGEIVLEAPQLMVGYWQRPAETEEMLRTRPDGTHALYTGDLGYLDADGYLFIVDRKKDLIKTSGFQVWPREIEEIISTHPAVAEVGVVGLPDKMKGESVKAFVVPRPGLTIDVAELRAYCKARLAPYKVPSQMEIVRELPKTMVGKVLRRELRRQEAEKAPVETGAPR